MSAQYYYAIMSNNPDSELKLDNIESIRDFFIKNPEVSVLFHTGLSGMKIECSTHTGIVGIASKEENLTIKNSFGREAFEKKIIEVEKAICRFAKYQLLCELAKLNNPSIMAVFKEYGLTFDGKTSHHSTAVDKALIKIMTVVMPKKESILARSMSFFSPDEAKKKIDIGSTHNPIYLAFEKHGIYEDGIDSIKSIGHVTDIMNMIKTTTLKEKPIHPKK